MRIARKIPLTGLLIALCACSAAGKTSIARIDYKGWKGCWELSNSVVKLIVVPQIGGRIMEYSIGSENVLWQNKAELGIVKSSDLGKKWHNYGGYKAWNAPQQRWRAPDYDNYYDYAPAKVEMVRTGQGCEEREEKMVGIRITTSPISHLGFRFERDIYLSERTSRVRIIERMRNISDSEIEWSIWDVTQVNAPCWIAFPLHITNDDPQGWRRLLGPEYPDPHQVTALGNVGILKYAGAIDKIGSSSPEGWMVYIKDRVAYIKQWSVRTVDAVYPDGGCNLEIFTADKAMGGYVEMEVLGPIVKLKPGETAQLVEDWFLSRLNGSAAAPDDVMERLKLLQRRGLLPRSVRL
jgi:hypothetical protein